MPTSTQQTASDEILSNLRQMARSSTTAKIFVGGGELGAPEDIYVDFVYQPLKDAAGQVFGIMAHVVETTEQVVVRQEIERKAAESKEPESGWQL